jgi:hypothetical protein
MNKKKILDSFHCKPCDCEYADDEYDDVKVGPVDPHFKARQSNLLVVLNSF